MRELRLSANTAEVFDEVFGIPCDPYSKTDEELSADWGHLRQMNPSLERLLDVATLLEEIE